jgi:hypothetical protein
VPLLYVWNDSIAFGELRRERALVGEDDAD